MKIASVADVKAHLSAYLTASAGAGGRHAQWKGRGGSGGGGPR